MREDPIMKYLAISIHAPLRERPAGKTVREVEIIFQSTLPCGSDPRQRVQPPLRLISIHAPLRERLQDNVWLVQNLHFNPRSLAGATATFLNNMEFAQFQSTLPCGSDAATAAAALSSAISIHAPLRERL